MIYDYFLDVLIGIAFAFFFISVGLTIVINTETIYYKDIDLLDIEKISGLDKSVIEDNYDSLMTYLSPKYKGELSLPNIKITDDTVSHFKDVKKVLKTNYIITAISGIVCCLIAVVKSKQKDYQFLFLSSITSVFLQLVFCGLMLYNFTGLFKKFYKLIFKNINWITDSSTNPIIKIFPEKYFMHCGLCVVIFSILCSICMFLIWINFKNKDTASSEG